MIAGITERMAREDWKQMADSVKVSFEFPALLFVAFSL